LKEDDIHANVRNPLDTFPRIFSVDGEVASGDGLFSMFSALEIFLVMRYINLLFTYLLTYLLVSNTADYLDMPR